MNLAKYITLIGEDVAAVARVREGFEWFASLEEGKQALEDALSLHTKPLEVQVNHPNQFHGYGDQDGNHVMWLNLLTMPHVSVNTTSGTEAITLERSISHECFHAGQSGIHEAAHEFIKERQRIADETFAPTYRAAQKFIYSQKDNIKDVRSLRTIAARTYDECIAPHLGALVSKEREQFHASPIITAFVSKFEDPAVDFENHILTKYGLGSARSGSYIDSTTTSEASLEAARENFIEAITAKYLEYDPLLQVTKAEHQHTVHAAGKAEGHGPVG